MRKLLALSIVIVALTVPLLAAWTYEQTFEGLTNGDLNGQDSWSGSTEFDVQATTFYQGSKAIEAAISSGAIIDRTITAITDTGDFFFAIRRTGTSNGELFFILRDTGDVSRIFIRAGSDGNISGYDNGAYNDVLAYSANTWYVVNCQFDISTEQFRLRVHNGTSWSAWDSWLTVNGGAFDGIETIRLEVADGNGSQTGYYDIISPNDPTGGGGGGGPTGRGLTLLGVGGFQ